MSERNGLSSIRLAVLRYKQLFSERRDVVAFSKLRPQDFQGVPVFDALAGNDDVKLDVGAADFAAWGFADHFLGPGPVRRQRRNDKIVGSPFADNLGGGRNNDTLDGGAGVDWLDGDAGDDTLFGGNDTDPDYFYGIDASSSESAYGPQIGQDTIRGGGGRDLVFFSGVDSAYDMVVTDEMKLFLDTAAKVLRSARLDGNGEFSTLTFKTFDPAEDEFCFSTSPVMRQQGWLTGNCYAGEEFARLLASWDTLTFVEKVGDGLVGAQMLTPGLKLGTDALKNVATSAIRLRAFRDGRRQLAVETASIIVRTGASAAGLMTDKIPTRYGGKYLGELTAGEFAALEAIVRDVTATTWADMEKNQKTLTVKDVPRLMRAIFVKSGQIYRKRLNLKLKLEIEDPLPRRYPKPNLQRLIEGDDRKNDMIRMTLGSLDRRIFDLLGGDDTLVVTGGQVIAYGGTGADRITTGSGDDILDGGTGNDRLVGRGGDDVYVVDAKGDVVVEASNGGRDEVRSASIDLDLNRYANVEVGRLTGRRALALFGSPRADVLIGNDAANVIRGGAGPDDLTSGKGADRFVYTRLDDSRPGRTRRDTISDFDGGGFPYDPDDVLDLSGIDAVPGTRDDDPFVHINNAPFSGRGREVRTEMGIENQRSITTVETDVDGDRKADFEIRLDGWISFRTFKLDDFFPPNLIL